VYGDKVRVVWKHFPLDFHPNAGLAALAAAAAGEQGKFWEFHDKIFSNQDKMTRAQYVEYAKQLGLNVPRFEASINAAKGKPTIDADAAEGKSVGVTGTPAFFVNGHFLSGARPFNDFAQVINGELSRLKIPIPAAAQQAAPPAGG
jgi:protein-disulfide isomerase